jgi:hypothetical protein
MVLFCTYLNMRKVYSSHLQLLSASYYVPHSVGSRGKNNWQNIVPFLMELMKFFPP